MFARQLNFGETMKNIRFIIKTFLLTAISTALVANVFGQPGEILVEGDPPLTRAVAASVLRYYERGLGVQFSEDDRAALQEKLAENWEKAQRGSNKGLEGFIRVVEKINAWDEAKIKAHQQELTDALIADLKSAPRNEFYKYVLKVYQNPDGERSKETAPSRADDSGRTENSRTETPSAASTEQTSVSKKTEASGGQRDFKPVQSAIRMSDLVGTWVKGSTASYGYRDTVTNDYKSGYGAANQHEIYAGGSFDYSNFAQVSLYGCTTELFTSMKGRAAITGSQVTFSYISGNVKGKDSCKATGFERPAQINKTTYQIESDGRRIRLCQIGQESPTCLYREEK
jgi:hypothetical protein